MKKIWNLKEVDSSLSERLASELGVSNLLAKILVCRGVVDPKEANRLIYPTREMTYDPYLLNDMKKGASRIAEAIKKGERIWIYGDYDVDGTTSIALLSSIFKELGAEAKFYIPHRLEEGYGLQSEAIKKLYEIGCDLIITVDCGATAFEQVALANRLGMDVIITDHHEPKKEVSEAGKEGLKSESYKIDAATGSLLPLAYAVINPKVGSPKYPFEGLAGVGVSFKLAQAVLRQIGQDSGKISTSSLEESVLDLVALGTISDVVPLLDENRALAKFGLERLNLRKRAGVRAICEVANLNANTAIEAYHIGFVIGPRINAAGRLETANKVVDLLTTDSYEKALEIAKDLDEFNQKRQSIERQILNQAKAMVDSNPKVRNSKAIVLADRRWHRGVVGIVASRLADIYYRPTIVIALEEDIGHGSGRSINEFDLFKGLTKCSRLLDKFGGHQMAAGLTLPEKNVEPLAEALSDIVASELSDADLMPKLKADLEILPSDLTLESVRQLSLLEPFGNANPKPALVIKNAITRGKPKLIKGSHIKLFVASDELKSFEAIGFGMGERIGEFKGEDKRVDLAFEPQVNNWNGTSSVQLRLLDFSAPVWADLYPTQDMLSRLRIADGRNSNKMDYLKELLRFGNKTLIYVRDNPALIKLKEFLEAETPLKIGCCMSGATKNEMERVFGQLNRGEIDLIASSEEIHSPLPELQNLVICHPPPNLKAFRQICISAVENSPSLCVHLLFGEKDSQLQKELLEDQYPNREFMIELYKGAQSLSNNGDKLISFDKLSDFFKTHSKLRILNGIQVLSELRLISVQNEGGERWLDESLSALRRPPSSFQSSNFMVSLISSEEKRDLSSSPKYLYGRGIKEDFFSFSKLLFSLTAKQIWQELYCELDKLHK